VGASAADENWQARRAQPWVDLCVHLGGGRRGAVWRLDHGDAGAPALPGRYDKGKRRPDHV